MNENLSLCTSVMSKSVKTPEYPVMSPENIVHPDATNYFLSTGSEIWGDHNTHVKPLESRL